MDAMLYTQHTPMISNRFPNLFLLPNRRSESNIYYCFYNIKKRVKTLNNEFISPNFKIQAVENNAPQLDVEKLEGSTTKSRSNIISWPSPEDETSFWEREIPSWDISLEGPVYIKNDSDLIHIVHLIAEMAPIAKVGGLGDVVTGLADCFTKIHLSCAVALAIRLFASVTGTQPDIIHVHEWQTSALPLLYWDMYHHLSLKKPRIVLTIHNMEHYGECSAEQLSKCGLDGSIYATEEKAVDDRTIGHNPKRISLLKGGIVYSNAIV